MKKNWFQTKEDLEWYRAQQEQEANLNKIIAANPNLQAQQAAIKALVKSEGLAPEDVIAKYGFNWGNKLAKARAQWDIKWSPETQKKTIADMSAAEWEKERVKLGIWSKWRFS